MKVATLIFLLLTAALTVSAQKERKFVREGNTLFNNQDFEKSEVEYRKALDKKAESFEAAFNLGDALYKQQKYDEALQQFSTLAKEETNREHLGELYHNIGNTLLAMQKTDESIEAYKESLRNRPTSQETKYNLEFARNKKQKDQESKDQNKDQQDQNKDQQDKKDQESKDQDKKDQESKDQENKDQKDKQDQNKDQENKDKNKDQNKDNKDQNKDQDKDQKNQQPKDQPGKISKQDAQRLLEALQNDEKKVQEKVQKEKVQQQKAKKMKIEKDW